MTYEEIIELGWMNRHKKSKDSLQTFCYKTEYGGKWIMAIFKPETNGLHQTTIKFVDDEVNHNEWENSDCHFYGYLMTKHDLYTIMRFLDIIEYASPPKGRHASSAIKLNEIKKLHSDGLSVRQIAKRLGYSSPSPVHRWINKIKNK